MLIRTASEAENCYGTCPEHQRQFGCGNSKMVGPKRQDFWPRVNILKGFFLKQSMNYSSSKSTKIVLSKSIFDVKKPISKKLQLRSINRLIGRPLLIEIAFSSLQSHAISYPNFYFLLESFLYTKKNLECFKKNSEKKSQNWCLK